MGSALSESFHGWECSSVASAVLTPSEYQILSLQSFPFKIIDTCYCFLAYCIMEEKLYVLSFLLYTVFLRHFCIFSLTFKLENVSLFLGVAFSLIFLGSG